MTRGPNAPLVEMTGVQKTYDGRTLVVSDLNLSIRKGEFLTLLGPSGSGKTTCLMMLAGFEVPTGGTILLGGRDITKLPPHSRGIGVVFQNYALFPHMTIAQNIGYPLKVRGTPKPDIDAKVADALDMVKLSNFADRRPAQLSGGQQQRVALARALVFNPEIVLLDEPLGALDKKLREEMQFEISQIHERLGVTMIYVTHDQSEALTMSDRIAVFNNGRIQQIDTPKALYQRPSNAFVAGFVGENNRLEGSVEHSGPEGVSVLLPDGARLPATAVDPLLPGDKVVLSIRPEAIRRDPRGADTLIEVEPHHQIYLGDSVRELLRFGGIKDFTAKTSAHDMPAQGDSNRFGWNRKDCLAFKA